MPTLTPHDAYELACDAYLYFYPLVTMDLTRRQSSNLAPMNGFRHLRTFPVADLREVVRPNFDTLYSSAWLDLTTEPVILSVPDTHGRYYLLQMLDMWTDVFAAPGSRTSGTQAGHFAITPPGWTGALPADVARIPAPTPYVWIIGRTQTNGPADYAAVHAIQDAYLLTPLSRWGQEPEPIRVQVDPAVDVETPPLEQVNAMSIDAFLTYAAELMKLHPPHVTDWSRLVRLSRLGIEPGQPFAFDRLDPGVRQALGSVPTDSVALMYDKVPVLARVVNGWTINTDTIGVYGNFYLKRAVVTLVGLGANQPADAIYPICVADADGAPLNGDHDYVLHFGKDDLPPVGAFWSVTMYDATGYQAANALNRFALGDRDPLHYNADGSLDLYLQHESPGAEQEPNWLPAPRGPLGVTLRMYAPGVAALEGIWAPPPIQRVG